MSGVMSTECAHLQVVGATALRLDGDTRLVRSQETNMGDILSDAMVASIARTQFSVVPPPDGPRRGCARAAFQS